MKLPYLGYEFEVPWTDLDESQTKLYPSDKTEKSRVDLHFRSGLRLLVTAVPSREMVDGLPKEFKVPPQALEVVFGRDTMKSDYSFLKAVYEFTPDKMNHRDFRRGMINRDEFLLIIKSIVLSSAADFWNLHYPGPELRGISTGRSSVPNARNPCFPLF
jgi:hypothetical protein